MSVNFIVKKYTRENKWRNWVFVFLIALGAGTGFLYAKGVNPISFTVEQSQKIVLGLQVEKVEETGDIGGDMVFEQNTIIVPKLSPSSTIVTEDMFTADAMLVKDKESNTVLFGKNEYNDHSIASITKLMSALILLEYPLDWTTSTVVIGADYLDAHMYKGDTYTLEELWSSGLVGSSNKAIMSLVHYLDMPEEAFVARMNDKARELGMSDTHFADTTGIDPENISTASDVLILLQEALRYDEIRNTLLLEEYTLYAEERKKEHHMWNTNWLLLGWVNHEFDELVGGKTGHIPSSGFNFTIEIVHEGHAIDIVVLGADSNASRFEEARNIAKWVFENYSWEE